MTALIWLNNHLKFLLLVAAAWSAGWGCSAAGAGSFATGAASDQGSGVALCLPSRGSYRQKTFRGNRSSFRWKTECQWNKQGSNVIIVKKFSLGRKDCIVVAYFKFAYDYECYE